MQATDQEGRDDLLELHDFSEETILFNIKKRYQEMDKIFTSVGAPILIAMNPYRYLPIFNQAFAQRVKDYSD